MKKTWSNTSLVAYSYLPKIVRELDANVKFRVKSSFKSAHLKVGVSNERLVREILDLNIEKRKIVDLRIAVADSLNALSDEQRRLLIERIIKKHTYKEVSEILSLPLRTVSRKLEEAQEAFAYRMKLSGFTEERLEADFAADDYISKIRERLIKDKYVTAKRL